MSVGPEEKHLLGAWGGAWGGGLEDLPRSSLA